MTDDMKNRSDKYWKEKLSPEQYHVLREKGTEHPGTGKHINNREDGVYICTACGQELFASGTKFETSSMPGWPSFSDPVNREHVELHPDNSYGMRRTEVTCANCGGHLGHVFDDGPKETGGQHYCINSVSLDFEPKNKT